MSYETPIHTIPSRCTLKFHHRQHIHSKAIMCSVAMCASDIRTNTVGAGSKEILNERMSLLTQGFVGMISDSLCFRAQKKLCQSFFEAFPFLYRPLTSQTPKSCKKKKYVIDTVAALSFQYSLAFVGPQAKPEIQATSVKPEKRCFESKSSLRNIKGDSLHKDLL